MCEICERLKTAGFNVQNHGADGTPIATGGIGLLEGLLKVLREGPLPARDRVPISLERFNNALHKFDDVMGGYFGNAPQSYSAIGEAVFTLDKAQHELVSNFVEDHPHAHSVLARAIFNASLEDRGAPWVSQLGPAMTRVSEASLRRQEALARQPRSGSGDDVSRADEELLNAVSALQRAEQFLVTGFVEATPHYVAKPILARAVMEHLRKQPQAAAPSASAP